MKAMLNHRSLKSGLDKGHIDEVAKDLNRYQTIERDREWLCVDQTPHRKKSFLVKHSKGVARWHVEMHKVRLSVLVASITLTLPNLTKLHKYLLTRFRKRVD